LWDEKDKFFVLSETLLKISVSSKEMANLLTFSVPKLKEKKSQETFIKIKIFNIRFANSLSLIRVEQYPLQVEEVAFSKWSA
jgi:hypothetical protein